jgi:hypothetical protein
MSAFAQVKPARTTPLTLDEKATDATDARTNQKINGPRKDTIGFEHRDDSKDSISISYRFMDSVRRNVIDSSVNDFDKYFSVPSHYQYLGNNGAAAFPLIYEPNMKPGFDPGFHAFDIYRYTLEGTRFYKTNRPFSMLGYQLASGKEQMLKAGHTQNPKPNLNAGFDYRLINAPGRFITQNNNHNAYRIFGYYQGKRKRYNAYLVVVGNTIRAAQNGGIRDDSSLLDPNYKDRFAVKVNLGVSNEYRQNPFITTVKTGNTYKDLTFFLRQSYDIGKKDSIAINDSTTEYLFYPKLRVQYSFTANTSSYRFGDVAADSLLYNNWYGLTLKDSVDTFFVQEKWRMISNDLSLVQFPDTKNAAQFFLAGATIQHITGEFSSGSKNFHNIFLHGEYRNRTRNKLWDVLLKGAFYVNGLNSGDYNVYARLERYFNKRFGNVSLFFSNVNRTQSFVFDDRSQFNFGNSNNYNKENTVSFGGEASNPLITLGFKNHLVSNNCYFKDYYHTAQYDKPINIIQVYASKKIKVYRKWNLYADATLQQTDAASPIRVPLVFTRSRLAYEGKLFRNLQLSTGIEVRYYTPYKANNFSPVTGQFTVQDTLTIKNLPDVNAFLHFRIKGFTGYIRTENLNTLTTKNGFGFLNNNFAAPHYPTQGFLIRFGIQWWFVN